MAMTLHALISVSSNANGINVPSTRTEGTPAPSVNYTSGMTILNGTIARKNFVILMLNTLKLLLLSKSVKHILVAARPYR